MSDKHSIHWRQEYLHLTMSLMTVCWLAPWIALSLGWFITLPFTNALEIAAPHLIGSTLLVRWLHHRRVSTNRHLIWMAVGLAVAIAATLLSMPNIAEIRNTHDALRYSDLFHFEKHSILPVGPFIILWVLFLWGRGSGLGTGHLTVVRTSFNMRLGILAFTWIILVSGSTLQSNSLTMIPPFFFLGLLGSSLARADSMSMDRARRGTIFGRGWIVALVFIALGITVFGYIAALWMVGMNVNEIMEALGPVGEALLTLVVLVFSPFLLLAQGIYDLIRMLLPDRVPGNVFSGNEGNQSSDQLTVPWIADLFSFLGHALIVALLIFLVLLILALVWFILLPRQKRNDYEGEERDVLGTGEVIGGLRQAFREGWRRLTDMLNLLRQFGLGSDLFAAFTIRRIYAQMEKLAGKRGYPRALSETPYEYYNALYQAFPALSEDIHKVTEAYIAVRYGEVPENETALHDVRAAWERLNSSPDPTTTHG
jgi:hypothetical protein